MTSYKCTKPIYYYDICLANIGDILIVKDNQIINSTTSVTYDMNNLPKDILKDNTKPFDKVISSEEQFWNIEEEMYKTYIKKNHDYGNSFEQSLDKFGLIASVVRLSDKINRLETLVKKDALVKDESIKDTLLDAANYAIMTVMWLNNQKGNDKVLYN